MRPLDWERVLTEHRVPFVTSGPNVKRGEWRAAPGFEGLYEVSDDGRVRSLTALRQHGGYRPRVIPGRVLKAKRSGRYYAVCLYDAEGKAHDFRVHVIVARAFVPNPEGLPLVRHLDDDGTNNDARNLAWGTHASNTADRFVNDAAGKKLTNDDVRAVWMMADCARKAGDRFAPGELQKIADAFGITTTMVNRILTEGAWTHVL